MVSMTNTRRLVPWEKKTLASGYCNVSLKVGLLQLSNRSLFTHWWSCKYIIYKCSNQQKIRYVGTRIRNSLITRSDIIVFSTLDFLSSSQSSDLCLRKELVKYGLTIIYYLTHMPYPSRITNAMLCTALLIHGYKEKFSTVSVRMDPNTLAKSIQLQQ